MWEGEKHFSVVVRLPEAERGLAELKKMLVDTPDGLHIPLEQVADVQEAGGSMNISRENGTRVIRHQRLHQGPRHGQRRGRYAGRGWQKITLPPGYFVTWSGEFENQQRAMKRLAVIVPVSVFLIFVLLFEPSNRSRAPLLILLNVPFALIGGIFALLLTGIPLERVGGDRLYRPVRPGGPQRRRDGQLLQSTPGRRADALRSGRARRA